MHVKTGCRCAKASSGGTRIVTRASHPYRIPKEEIDYARRDESLSRRGGGDGGGGN